MNIEFLSPRRRQQHSRAASVLNDSMTKTQIIAVLAALRFDPEGKRAIVIDVGVRDMLLDALQRRT